MGLNFNKTTKANVGDIIYPAYNGTNGFFKSSRWDLVVQVYPDGTIKERRYIWDIATVKAIELIQSLYELKLKKVKKK